MGQIRQSDVFKLLCMPELFQQNGVPCYTQAILADMLGMRGKPSTQESRMSEIVRGKRDGIQNLDVDDFYRRFFASVTDKMTPPELEAHFTALKKRIREGTPVHAGPLTFEGWEGTETDTCESYVKRMLAEALPNWRRDAFPDSDSPGIPEARQIPRLHSQRIVSQDHFMGREDILRQMARQLSEKNAVVLYGMGGIGKTYLSEKYASLHREDYDYIQRVAFSGETKSFRGMIAALSFDGLTDTKLSEEQRFEQKLDFLKRLERPALLIFDKVDDEPDDRDILYSLLRESGHLHVIVTTRLRGVFRAEFALPVKALSEEEQTKLLLYHLDRPFEDGEEPQAREVLNYIEGHTLMIEMVGKCMEQREYRCRDMLRILRQGGDLPAVSVEKDGASNREKIRTVLRTLLFNVTSLTKEEQTLLGWLSLLPEDGISRRLLSFHLLGDDARFTESLGSLERSSWVQKNRGESGKITRIHPLIREVIVSPDSSVRPSPGNCRQFIRRYLSFLKSPKSGKFAHDLCGIAQEILYLFSSDEELSKPELESLLTIELFCWNQYHYEIAENLCARLLRACDTQHVERPLQGKIYRRRGEVYRKKRQYESALKDDNMALSMFTDKLDIAEAENGIGIVYMHMGEDEESLPKRREYYRQAMRFCQHAQELREEHGAPPLERACSRHIIGTICYDLGEYEKALDNHRRALKLRLAHRCNQLDVAASYNRIGTDYLILGDLENAEKMTRKALELREETVGPNHPHYAWSLYNLFLLHREQGKFQIALLEIERVVDIRKSALGSAHHDTRQAVQEYERLKKGTDEACAPVTSAPTCQKSVAALTANGVKAAEDARVSGHTANQADAES